MKTGTSILPYTGIKSIKSQYWFDLAYQVGGEVAQWLCNGSCTPELILGSSISGVIDVWSHGVRAVKITTASSLLSGTEECEFLKLIGEYYDQPTDDLWDYGKHTESYFSEWSNREQHWWFKTPAEFMKEMGNHAEEKPASSALMTLRR